MIIPVILTAVFLVPLSVAGTAIALPAISQDLGSGQAGLQWAVTGFNAAFAVFMLVTGVFADRFGCRLTFVIGSITILVSSALSSLAQGMLMLNVGRVLAGIGCAAVVAGGAAAISFTYPRGALRARKFAVFGTTVGVGLAVGPSIAGVLVSGVGWRGVYAIVGAVVLVVLATSGVLPSAGPPRPGGFRLMELAPLRDRRFLAFALAPLAPAVGFVTLMTYMPVALAAMFAMSAPEAALVMLPMTVPALLGPLLSARIVSRVPWIGPTTIVYVSVTALVVGDLGMLLLSPDIPLGWVVVPLVLLGLGYGLPMGLIDGEAVAALPEGSGGTAVGTLNFLRSGAAALAVAGYGFVIAALIGTSLPASTAAGVAAGASGHGDVYAAAFHTTAMILAGLVAAVGLLLLWLHRGPGGASRA